MQYSRLVKSHGFELRHQKNDDRVFLPIFFFFVIVAFIRLSQRDSMRARWIVYVLLKCDLTLQQWNSAYFHFGLFEITNEEKKTSLLGSSVDWLGSVRLFGCQSDASLNSIVIASHTYMNKVENKNNVAISAHTVFRLCSLLLFLFSLFFIFHR